MVVCCAGEFHLRLRQLEKSLLQALNDAKGKILDDDSVITTLETLKQEAADISKKVEETDKVIAEIETVSQQYMPLSQVRGNLTIIQWSIEEGGWGVQTHPPGNSEVLTKSNQIAN